MKRTSATARVRKARAELAQAELALEKDILPWRKRLHRHRAALVLFGGFSSGLALTLLPTHWWARVGALVGTTAASAARSALTPTIIGAALSQLRRNPDASESGVAQDVSRTDA